jgi:hypothetical protein
MGAEIATDLVAPSGPLCDVDADRVRRLQRIGDVVRLYEDLEHVLARMDERELKRITARTRRDERPLAFWARRIARARGLTGARSDAPLLVAVPRGRRLRRRTVSRVLEAIAFVLGFGVSLLLIVKGA